MPWCGRRDKPYVLCSNAGAFVQHHRRFRSASRVIRALRRFFRGSMQLYVQAFRYCPGPNPTKQNSLHILVVFLRNACPLLFRRRRGSVPSQRALRTSSLHTILYNSTDHLSPAIFTPNVAQVRISHSSKTTLCKVVHIAVGALL